MTNYVYDSEEAVINAALEYMEARAKYVTDVFTTPEASKRMLRLRSGDREAEVFTVLFLDSQHGLICAEDMFMGTIDGAAVYPREVLKRALAHNSAALILGHNHPSGAVEPSAADRRITERLVSALKLVDIRVLDHVIVAADDAFSFAESGLL